MPPLHAGGRGGEGSDCIYTQQFGLHPVINAMGSMTSLGGSRMDRRVGAAMTESSQFFVDLNGLLARAGDEVCVCGCEVMRV